MLTGFAEKDFAPISLIGSQANILVVNPALPVRTMVELIALAKAAAAMRDRGRPRRRDTAGALSYIQWPNVPLASFQASIALPA